MVALALAALLVVQQRERTERERQRARATLESAIDSMSDGFVMFDAEDRLVVCNERYKDFYAISAPFIVPGASFEHIIREGARSAASTRRPGKTWKGSRGKPSLGIAATTRQWSGCCRTGAGC